MGILVQSFKHYFYHLFKILLAGILWLILSLPLISIGPATAGYSYFIYQITNREDSRLKHFFYGTKYYFKQGLTLKLVVFIPLIILLVNFIYFFQQPGFLPKAYGMLCFYCVIVWVLLTQYAFAVLVHDPNPSFKRISRNIFYILKQDFWKGIFLLFPVTLLTFISFPTVIAFIFVMLPLHFLIMHHYLLKKNIANL